MQSPGDTVTATLANGVTQTASLPVSAPALGSIQYVSTVTTPATTPPVITLKGTGGADRSETARVTFKVVDSAGNPVGNTLVNFSLNTSLGGLTLSSASATSDPTTGYVVTNVIAGTISTAVRVTATHRHPVHAVRPARRLDRHSRPGFLLAQRVRPQHRGLGL